MSELFNKAFPASKAFLIGVQNYTGGLSPLQTPFNDIDDLKLVLDSAHGFLCPEVEDEDTGRIMSNPLKDPVANDIRAYLRSIRCGANDRVLIYFACHGIAEEWDERPKGFILATDAGMKKGAGYISMDEIMSELAHLRCRHLLLVLDCCFAGAIRWAGNTRGISGMVPKSISVELFSQFSQSCARQILTSSTFEESLDTIGTRENQGRNSPFAGILIHALETGAADLRFGQDQCDGLISVSELHLYIRDRIFRLQHAGKRKLENRQIPLLLPFGKHDKGEFVFLNPKVPLGLHRRSEFNPYKGIAEFGFADSAVFYGREAHLRAIRGTGFDFPEKGGGITVIYGPARCGKTSLARAGLLARYWCNDTSLSKVHTISAGSSLNDGFREVLKEVYESREMQYLLIDPFDEWLSDSIGAQESRMMTEAVSKLADQHQIILIIRPMQERKLRKLLAAGGELYRGWKDKITWFEIPPPSADEIMGMIERPAVQQMLPFASDEADDEGGENFINRLVQDLLDEPGAVSLLSQTMHRLYRDRAMSHDSLSEATYDNFGTVTGILAGQAESVYALYSDDLADRKAFQLLCFRMIQFSGGKVVASKINISGWLREGTDELQYTDAATSLRMWRISQELLRAGVITEELKGDEYSLLPAHSRFFPKWDRMQGWLSEKQDGHEVKNIIRLHHGLAEACTGWEGVPTAKQHQLLGTWAARHDLWEMEKPLKPMLNKQEQAFFEKVAERRKYNIRNRRARYAVAGAAILALAIVGLFGSYTSYQTALKVFTEKLRTESLLHPPTVKLRMLEWASKVYPSVENDSIFEDTWNEGVQELHFSHQIIPMEQKVDSVHVLANGCLLDYEDGTADLLDRTGKIIRHLPEAGWSSPSFSKRYFIRETFGQISVWSESGEKLVLMDRERNDFTVNFNGLTDDVIFIERIWRNLNDNTGYVRVWRPGTGVVFKMLTYEMLDAYDREAFSDQPRYLPNRNEMLIAGYDERIGENEYNSPIGEGQYLYDVKGHRRKIHNDLHVLCDPVFIGYNRNGNADSIRLFGKTDWVNWVQDESNYNKTPVVSGNLSTALVFKGEKDFYWRGIHPGDTSYWDYNLSYYPINASVLSEDGHTLFALDKFTLFIADFITRKVTEVVLPTELVQADESGLIFQLKPSRSGNYLLFLHPDGCMVFDVKTQTFKNISPQLKDPVFANDEGDTLLALSPDKKLLHFVSKTGFDSNLNSFGPEYVRLRQSDISGNNALLLSTDSMHSIGFSLASHQWLNAAGVQTVLDKEGYKMPIRGARSLVLQNLPGGDWKVDFRSDVKTIFYDNNRRQAIIELSTGDILFVDGFSRKVELLPFNSHGFKGCQFKEEGILIAGDTAIYTVDRTNGKTILQQQKFHFSSAKYFCEKNGSGDYVYSEPGGVIMGNIANGVKWKRDLGDMEVYKVNFQEDHILVTGTSMKLGKEVWYILNRSNGNIQWKRSMPGALDEKVYDEANRQIVYLVNNELKVYSFPDRIRELLRKPIMPSLPESISRQWTPKRLESWWNYVFSTSE